MKKREFVPLFQNTRNMLIQIKKTVEGGAKNPSIPYALTPKGAKNERKINNAYIIMDVFFPKPKAMLLDIKRIAFRGEKLSFLHPFHPLPVNPQSVNKKM